MSRYMHFLAYLAIVLAEILDCSQDCSALPPPQTLNFDFGDGPAYSGDDGVLSSQDGNYWNRVTAADLNGSSNSGLGGNLQTFDEFSNPTAGEVFSRGPDPFSFPKIAGWEDPLGADFGLYPSFPIVDSISPGVNDGPYAYLSIFRVEKFEEMIIYFNTPLPLGGFVSWQSPETLVTPFADFPIQIHSFGDQSQLSYVRVLTPPPRPGLLGAGRTITISVPNLDVPGLAAIQIRGAFGLPEPTSASICCVAILIASFRRNRCQYA